MELCVVIMIFKKKRKKEQKENFLVDSLDVLVVHAIISLEKNNDFITPSMIAKKINEYGFKNSVGKNYSAIAIGKTLKELGLQTINKKIDGKKFRIIPRKNKQHP
jgi:hypothetical protein